MRAILQLCAMMLVMLPSYSVLAKESGRVPRTIIALYDGQIVNDNDNYKLIHRIAELPLNHLGLIVEYHDVRKGLPNLSKRADVRGFLTWFSSPDAVQDKPAFANWLEQAVKKHGKKMVVLGNAGFDLSDKTLALLGLAYQPCSKQQLVDCGWNEYLDAAEYTVFDKDMMGYEWPIAEYKYPYNALKRVSDEAKVYLALRPREQSPYEVPLVVTNANGGYIDVNYAFISDYNEETLEDKRAWIVNPFAFFAQAFATDDLPKPDTTTLAGRRIYFSHIDGDGWYNVSQVQRYRNKPTLSGEVLRMEMIEPYPDMPVTMAFIGAEMDPKWIATPKGIEAAKVLAALPQVEVGVHTHSHPFAWGFFERYSKARELPYLHRFWQGNWAGHKAPKMPENYQYELENYYVPRAYAKEPFDLQLEITGAKERVEAIAGAKPVTILMWSGDCAPFAEAIKLTQDAGMFNLNGGDNRFDERFPSVGWLAPIGRSDGGYRQIYAAASNENTYTNGWQKPFMGFELLKQTWDNTESPVRLKPINLYYHVFSVEHGNGLTAAKGNLDYARSQPITPIKASDYASLAMSFYEASFEPLSSGGWAIHNRGTLQTLRFDGEQGKQHVNLDKSQGIVGYRQHQGSLYVYLDAAVKQPTLVLTAKADALPSRPYLIESRWPVRGVETEKTTLRFTAQGYGQGEMRWHMPKAGRYVIQGADSQTQTVETDAQGVLAFTAQGSGMSAQKLTINLDTNAQ